LRNSEPISCAAEASCFRNRQKVAKMTNVQRLRHANKNIVRRAREMQSDSWTKVFGPRKHSGLIEAQNSAFIGKTYRAISETFERHI
jgi:hypothetical protein